MFLRFLYGSKRFSFLISQSEFTQREGWSVRGQTQAGNGKTCYPPTESLFYISLNVAASINSHQIRFSEGWVSG